MAPAVVSSKYKYSLENLGKHEYSCLQRDSKTIPGTRKAIELHLYQAYIGKVRVELGVDHELASRACARVTQDHDKTELIDPVFTPGLIDH